MFLRCTTRKKNGKEHRYWNLVENRRVAGGQVMQRQVLYLGEINDSQCEVWRKSIEVFEDSRSAPRTVALFAEEQTAPIDEEQVIQVRLKDLEVRNARQWGGCWLVCELYEQLKLDQFRAERLPPGRKGTRWALILQTLCIYRFIEPGSEWRLHRNWFDRSAVPELLGSDFRLAESHRLYECHDLLLKHKGALFTHLTERWKDLFNAKFEILLYDLTSTYFECDPPIGEADKRKFGHSRDKRSDCVQVVIALIVTPEGFPIAYEVLAGNTTDKTTLRDFLKKIEAQYGKAERTWVLDRSFRVNRAKFREPTGAKVNSCCGPPFAASPATLWEYYTQLTEIEEAFQKAEGGYKDSPRFSSASPSHRGPHLHRLSDLLSSCHSAPPLARLGSRINSSCRPGEVQREADDRCFIFPPLTAGPSSFRVTPSPRPTFSSCSNSSNSNYPSSRRPKSRPPAVWPNSAL